MSNIKGLHYQFEKGLIIRKLQFEASNHVSNKDFDFSPQFANMKYNIYNI